MDEAALTEDGLAATGEGRVLILACGALARTGAKRGRRSGQVRRPRPRIGVVVGRLVRLPPVGRVRHRHCSKEDQNHVGVVVDFGTE